MEHPKDFAVGAIFITEMAKGLYDNYLDRIESAIKSRRFAIANSVKQGDTARLIPTISPKYLANQQVRVLGRPGKNFLVELVDKSVGGRYADSPFTVQPSFLVFNGAAPSQQDLDDLEDADDDLPGGYTIRDFKVGDKVITGDIHPYYIAHQKGYVAAKRRVKVLVKFDNPPVGTRFEGGVVMRPSRLIKR